MKNFFVCLMTLASLACQGQFGNRDANNEWDASWITVPGAPASDAGLYLFRKTLHLEAVPSAFEVRVSGDNRYKLYVNGTLVSLGPVLSDIQHWNYETVDLVPYLKAGDNLVSALVWNEGSLRPVSQFSYRTGFLLQGTDEPIKTLNSDTTWMCAVDRSYTPIPQRVRGYYAAGAGDRIDMKYQQKGWSDPGFDESEWTAAVPVFERTARGMGFFNRNAWNLVPSILPPMEMTDLRLKPCAKSKVWKSPPVFPT
ncbi:MAG: alpha-L-rhamnosidase N-terminal domain-containing protein [Bacteroidales bacterium]